MHIDDIKRGLRAEIKKRENEKYATFECNIRQMCKDVLAKLEEQESVIAEKDTEIRRLKRALWLARAERADDRARIFYFNDLESLLDIDGFSYDSKKKKDHKKSTARDWRITWLKVERKCRAKAEEYK